MGSVQSVSIMWGLGDIGFGSMSYLNLIAIVFLSKPALRALRDFERQTKLGVDPVFDQKLRELKMQNYGKKSVVSIMPKVLELIRLMELGK